MMRLLFGSMLAFASLSASLLTLAGCGGSAAQSESNASEQQALLEVGELYRLFTISSKKPPARLEDLRRGQTVGPVGFQAVQDGSIVVLYSAQLNDTSEEGSTDSAEEVLAYQKDVPEKGGLVLMKNRTVRSVTAEQFKSMAKAGK